MKTDICMRFTCKGCPVQRKCDEETGKGEQMWNRLKENRDKLTLQEYRTLKGQLIAGDIDGARKGLEKILKRRKDAENVQTLRNR